MNEHEEGARWRKVACLLAALYKHRAPLDVLAKLTEQQWALVAAAAGVRAPSTTTVELLTRILADVPKAPQRATCVGGGMKTPGIPGDEDRCPVCETWVIVKRNGTLRAHRGRTT